MVLKIQQQQQKPPYLVCANQNNLPPLSFATTGGQTKNLRYVQAHLWALPPNGNQFFTLNSSWRNFG